MLGYFDLLGIDTIHNQKYYDDAAKYLAGLATNIDSQRLHVHNLRMSYDMINQGEEQYEAFYNPLIKQVKDELSGKLKEMKVFKSPLTIKNYPILRTRLNSLISEESLRPLDFKIAATDIIANQERMKAEAEYLFEKQKERFDEKMRIIEQQQRNLSLQKQLQSQQMAAMPEQERQQLLAQLDSYYQEMEQKAQQAVVFNQKELAEAKKMFDRSYLPSEEMFASMIIEWYIEFAKLRNVFNIGWKEKLLSDNEIYFVDWDYTKKHATIKNIAREMLHIPVNIETPRLHQLDWGVITERMSMGNILAEFNHRVNKEAMEYIKKNIKTITIQDNAKTDFYGNFTLNNNVFNTIGGSYPNPGETTNIYRCYWKCVEKQYYKFMPNKSAGIPDTAFQLSEDEYMKEMRRSNKKGRVEVRYRTDLCSGVVINNDYVLYADKHPVQVRLNDNFTTNWLPIIGKNNSAMNPTISVFELGCDIQETINILYYQANLLIVMSGVKGMVYDLSQKPDGMGLDEIMFYRSQGLMLIQTLNATDGKQISSFNQFQNYDDGVSQSIGVILSVIEQYKQLLNEIIGIPDSRAATIDASNRVGNTMHEYRQSLVVTEGLYIEHEETMEEVFTRLAMLNKVAYAEGYDFGQFYSMRDNMNKMLSLPPNILTGDFKAAITIGRRQSEELKRIKEIAQNQLQQGKMKDSHFLEIYASKDFSSILELVKGYEEDFEKMIEAKQQSNSQMQQQIMEQTAQREFQMKQALEQIKTEREREKLTVQSQLQKYIKEAEIATWNKEIDTKAEIEMTAINKDAEIEMGYLQQRYDQSMQQVNMNNKQIIMDMAEQKIAQYKSKENLKD